MVKGPGLLLPGLQASVYLLAHEAGIAESLGESTRAAAYRQAADLLAEQYQRMRSIKLTGRADGGEREQETGARGRRVALVGAE